ncbi:hypothetical protein KP77_05300 [Jeotgalibacillus alimentarius]|uniref:DUF3784 domain-containing protein n=1 Tax=Jeotgalibacillus alimentarius TaxID=135826 RepID=A0A0C2SHZ0_9BACL|nr:DUF3784 domain-containing protein [Jeotgalibacillus alimentarius]KIL53554.1 hypothetical protein KP77_05300 [Jeotgalibacillus alimentarius]
MEAAIVNFVLMVPFLIIGVVFSRGKGASLIAGYNTMPEDEKAKYDEVALCKFMGKIMYGVSFSLLLFGLSEILNFPILLGVGIVLLFVLIIFAVVYSNTGDRFKKGL